jgi:hypothetical protein
VERLLYQVALVRHFLAEIAKQATAVHGSGRTVDAYEFFEVFP